MRHLCVTFEVYCMSCSWTINGLPSIEYDRDAAYSPLQLPIIEMRFECAKQILASRQITIPMVFIADSFSKRN